MLNPQDLSCPGVDSQVLLQKVVCSQVWRFLGPRMNNYRIYRDLFIQVRVPENGFESGNSTRGIKILT